MTRGWRGHLDISLCTYRLYNAFSSRKHETHYTKIFSIRNCTRSHVFEYSLSWLISNSSHRIGHGWVHSSSKKAKHSTNTITCMGDKLQIHTLKNKHQEQGKHASCVVLAFVVQPCFCALLAKRMFSLYDSITFLSNNTKPSAPTKKVTSHSHVILGVPPAGTSTDQGSYPFELFKFHDFPWLFSWP